MNRTLMKMTFIATLLCVAALVSPASATQIGPGQSTTSLNSGDASGALLADTGLLHFSLIDGTSGTVRELVVADTLNPYGSGDLSFIYQVTVNSNSPHQVEHLTGADYSTWLTDVSQATPHSPLITSGSVGAASANRSVDGSTVSFNFTGLTAGQGSLALIIRTNSTVFTRGTIGVIDGAAESFFGYQPGPEPSSIVLFAGAFIGLGVVGLRRRMKARAA